MNFEVAVEMQRISTGEKRKLSRGQIAEEVLDIKSLTKDFNEEKTAECMDFYNKLISDDAEKEYDVELIIEESDALKKEMEDFIRNNIGSDIFSSMYDDIGEFFMTPPFEGLDNIEYGVNEVCVFSILEYFMWKAAEASDEDYDHEKCRAEYRDSIAKRTYEEVADHWIDVYDDLQKRYGKLEEKLKGNPLAEKIAACAIVAISAIRDQDKFALDMVEAGAVEKGRAIFEDFNGDEYTEGESVFTDNVAKLLQFVYGHVNSK